MWQEAGKPQTVTVYSIMKRTRHQYHYAVRCSKKKLKVQKQKLSESISHSTLFWNEINKLNPTSKTISNSIDDANGSKEISNHFYKKNIAAFTTAFRLMLMNWTIFIML